MIDGYTRFEDILRIIIPLSLPAPATVRFIYAYMIAWNEYLFASIFLTTRTNFTLPIGLDALSSGFHQGGDNNNGRIAADQHPHLIIMFVYLEKYMVEGLTFGSVEGLERVPRKPPKPTRNRPQTTRPRRTPPPKSRRSGPESPSRTYSET